MAAPEHDDLKTLSIRDLRKKFGAVEVLKGIELDLEDGGFLVLLGPSGCGKSTLLNIIAGLEDITEGNVYIGGDLANDLHPKDRNIAMVFQSYALYPSMSVHRNIAFGLHMRGVDRATQDEAVKRVAKMLDIEHLLERRPAQLSGGQRQRVAMGRALVRDPILFLFDEPLSNLDAKLRVQMRTEIKKLHNRLSSTIVYVTHDQVEAMTLATMIAVMRDGVIQQYGTPEAIYETPTNTFVAGFVGSPQMNFLPGALQETDGRLAVRTDPREGAEPTTIHLGLSSDAVASPKEANRVILGLRPEALRRRPASDGTGSFSARIDLVERTGADTIVSFNVAGQEVTARLPAEDKPALGDEMEFSFDTAAVHLFDEKTTDRLN